MIREALRRTLSVLLALAGASGTACADTPLSLPAQVGKQIFFDQNLSGSRKMSCATCHDPANHYAPPNALAVQRGGPNLKQTGTRAVPTLTYKNFTTPYADLADNPDGVSAPGPGGGFTWDGRAPTLADQAQIPLLSPIEMANKSFQSVVAKLQAAAYAPLFKQAFGANAFKDPSAAFGDALAALQAYQLEDSSFHPYTSKYDLYASNKIGGTLSAAEIRGMVIFQDPARGNCAACHYNGPGVGGGVAQFTDYSYEAIGVPRNVKDIAANRLVRGRRAYFDMGLCSRSDHPPASSKSFCGLFKTPTLRNVATRKVFFHNGQIKSLTEAINFYATRDTHPERWYPTVAGVVQKYDDLPARYRGNIDTQMPLDGRAPGSTPPLSAQDVSDLVAFLGTLTDGYVPPPAGSAAAAQ